MSGAVALQKSGKRSLAYVAVAILLAGVLVSATLILVPLSRSPTTMTGTSTLTSIITETITSYVNTTSAVPPGSICCSGLAPTSPQSAATTLADNILFCTNDYSYCLYLYGWGVNYTSSELFIVVGLGPRSGTVTLANATFSGSPTNKGYTGSVTVNLNSLTLGGYEQTITSSALPNLQRGDQWTVTVRGTAGAYFAATLTETAGSQH